MIVKEYNIDYRKVDRELFLSILPKWVQKYAQVCSDSMEMYTKGFPEDTYYFSIDYYPDTKTLAYTVMRYVKGEDYAVERYMRISPYKTFVEEDGRILSEHRIINREILYRDIERSTVKKVEKVIKKQLLK